MRTEPDPRGGVRGRHSGGPAGGDDPLLDRVLEGRYRIVEKVARGGMATVYVAHDQRLDRVVAVKVMHQHLDEDGGFAERFVREARSAAKLSHPNVVAVYDQGEDGDVAFLAMEFIDGHTLRDTIASQAPLGAAKALAYLEPILSALAAAHSIGIVHRDIKPENVLITTGMAAISQRVRVVDFGLARAVTSNTDAHTGTLVGTVSYLAPELVTEGRSDPRTDVYAAGIVLYELLTGRKPHSGGSAVDIAYKHVHEDVPRPSMSAPGIPRYVDALVARATARDAALRPADAGVLLKLVHRVQTTLASGIVDDPELTADLQLARAGETTETESPKPATGKRAANVQVPLPAVSPPAPPAGSPEATAVLPAGALAPALRPGSPNQSFGRPPAGPPGPPPAAPPPGVGLSSGAAGPLSLRTDRHEPPVRIAPTPSQPRGRLAFLGAIPHQWRGPAVAVVTAALVGLLAFGLWWLIVGRYDQVPSVALQSQAQATATLEKAGFKVSARTGFSDTVPKGQVIESDPDRGGNALPGSTVKITVSKGIEQYPVPKVAGLVTDDAQDAVLAAHLDVGEPRKQYSDSVPEGHVIRSVPGAGTELRPGRPVVLVISKGGAPVDVLDWTGRDVNGAKQALTQSGLVPKINEVENADVAPGTVISQDPSGGTLAKGDTVTLTVAKGPAMVQVPDVKGYAKDDAEAALTNLGFKVKFEDYWFDVGLDQVAEEDHVGEQLPYGSEITLKIN